MEKLLLSSEFPTRAGRLGRYPSLNFLHDPIANILIVMVIIDDELWWPDAANRLAALVSFPWGGSRPSRHLLSCWRASPLPRIGARIGVARTARTGQQTHVHKWQRCTHLTRSPLTPSGGRGTGFLIPRLGICALDPFYVRMCCFTPITTCLCGMGEAGRRRRRRRLVSYM